MPFWLLRNNELVVVFSFYYCVAMLNEVLRFNRGYLTLEVYLCLFLNSCSELLLKVLMSAVMEKYFCLLASFVLVRFLSLYYQECCVMLVGNQSLRSGGIYFPTSLSTSSSSVHSTFIFFSIGCGASSCSLSYALYCM